jgi:hypothetical protein
MSMMFYQAYAFNQNIGGWNITKVTLMSNMFNSVTLSTANYDSLLVGWGAEPVTSSVTFSGGNSKYLASPNAAGVARAHLISAHSWTITDGGQESATTTATATIALSATPSATASITCNRSTWAPPCGVGSQAATVGHWGNITNTGIVYVTIKVKVTNPGTWTIGGSASHNVFKMDCTPFQGADIVLTVNDQTFAANLANAAKKDFGLSIIMPISSSTNVDQTTIITFTATVN